MEQGLTILFFLCASWLWCVIAAAIAETVRQYPSATTLAAEAAKYPTTPTLIVFDGAYLSTASSCVYAVFLGFGTGFLAWVKLAYGPRFALATVLGSIIMDVVLTYGALIPGSSSLNAIIWRY